MCATYQVAGHTVLERETIHHIANIRKAVASAEAEHPLIFHGESDMDKRGRRKD
jgi:hypothetical protein